MGLRRKLEKRMESKAKAVVLLESVRSALASGTRHYNDAGVLLKTEGEILRALRDEGHVKIVGPGGA